MSGCAYKGCERDATRRVVTSATIPGIGPVEIPLDLCDDHATAVFDPIIGVAPSRSGSTSAGIWAQPDDDDEQDRREP